MNISQWLSISGVDLDKTLDEQEYPVRPDSSGIWSVLEGTNGYGENGTFPMARLAGVELVLSLNYYQRILAPPPYKKLAKGSAEVICVIDVVPKFRWSVRGADVRYMVDGPDDPFFLSPNNSTKGKPGELMGTQVNIQRNGIKFTFIRGGR